MRLSIDFSDRSYSAAAWVQGVVIAGYIYKHPWRTEWHTPTLSQKVAKHFAGQVDSWEAMYGPVEEIAIEKKAHNWGRWGTKQAYNPAIVERWGLDVRAALWDTAVTIGETISVSREEKHRENARKYRTKLGFKHGPLLTAAIMVGMTADYDTKKELVPSNRAPMTARRAALVSLSDYLKKPQKTLTDVEKLLDDLIGFCATIGEDEKYLLQNIAAMRGLLRDKVSIMAQKQDALIQDFEKRLKALENGKKD